MAGLINVKCGERGRAIFSVNFGMPWAIIGFSRMLGLRFPSDLAGLYPDVGNYDLKVSSWFISWR